MKIMLKDKEITDSEKFKCLDKAGIIKYSDVYHKGAYITLDLETETLIFHEEKMVYKNGEGPKIPHKIYESLLQTLQEKSNNNPLTKSQLELITNAIENKQFFAGVLKIQKTDTPILTGLDNHVALFVKDPENPEYVYCLGFFTSAKDPGTIELSSTQEFNTNLSETKKAQGFRPARMLVHLKKKDIYNEVQTTIFWYENIDLLLQMYEDDLFYENISNILLIFIMGIIAFIGL